MSDGIKSYRQLYNELFTKIDWNRINYRSSFVLISDIAVYTYCISGIQTNLAIRFVNSYSDSVTHTVAYVAIAATSYQVSYSQTRNTNFTYTDGSNQVAPNNRYYRIYYR